MRIRSYKDRLNPNEKYRENCFTHCQDRMWERYKDTLSRQEYDKLCKEIKDGSQKHVHFHNQKKTKEFWIIKHKLKLFWVVFDTDLQLISTFMNPNWFELYYPKFTNSARALLIRKGLLVGHEEWDTSRVLGEIKNKNK